MSTNPSDTESKIYSAPHVLDLRRVERADGTSFMTYFVDEQAGDAPPVSVGVELRLTKHCGNIAFTMRRVASTCDSWHCSSSTIHLPPDAAEDLAQSVSLLAKQLRH